MIDSQLLINAQRVSHPNRDELHELREAARVVLEFPTQEMLDAAYDAREAGANLMGQLQAVRRVMFE